MNFDSVRSEVIAVIKTYHIHFLVFLLVFFLGLTFAHPTILIDDEWITANQLYQLHQGQQFVMFEGKYGFDKFGNVSPYFAARSNVLGYSIFLPLISLPVLSGIDILGDHFAFFILYLWTITSLGIVILLHFFHRKYMTIGHWQLTPAITVGIFAVFFINLFYYRPFPVMEPDTFPELIAIVFTNILLLAITAVIIYEILRTIFTDPAYSFFGTAVILSGSSYLFWTTGCKDHILVLPFFSAIVLCLVKYQKIEDPWYFPLAFAISGLLAWARPELALWVFLLILGFALFSFVRKKSQKNARLENILLLLSPFFTLIGALPFFLNNYLVTRNFLRPAMAMYLSEGTGSGIINNSSYVVSQNGIESLVHVISTRIQITPGTNLLSDFFGTFFLPQNGSIGVLPLVPLFLVMVTLTIILIFMRKMTFNSEERNLLFLIMLIALSVFIAYFSGIHQLNTSGGIAPDIRYLSPIYLPLGIFGLILLKKQNLFIVDPIALLRKMFFFGIAGIPLSIIMFAGILDNSGVSGASYINQYFSTAIFVILLVLIVLLIRRLYSKKEEMVFEHLLALLLILPVLWQINISIYTWQFGSAEGYTFWIPIIYVLFTKLSEVSLLSWIGG